MGNLWKRFISDESGQDYSEYALMLAFVTVFASALFLLTVEDIHKIWTSLNSFLSLSRH